MTAAGIMKAHGFYVGRKREQTNQVNQEPLMFTDDCLIFSDLQFRDRIQARERQQR